MIIKYISKKSYFLNLIKVNNFLSYQIIIFKIIMNISKKFELKNKVIIYVCLNKYIISIK